MHKQITELYENMPEFNFFFFDSLASSLFCPNSNTQITTTTKNQWIHNKKQF